ncbi:MAG: hypothetical protein JO142_01805 [Burkholderiales bacterium]|nr:hypothetical protein [Burkholderiales bacterium]
MNKSLAHAVAGTMAMLIVATFWTSTLVSELFLGHGAVVAVKHAIVVYGLLPLVLAMATTGASGLSVGKERKGRLLDEKKKRMPLMALNGVLIMIPAALFLNHKASLGVFDPTFYVVQTVELVVGVAQLALMAMNFRAGLRLAGRLRPAARQTNA